MENKLNRQDSISNLEEEEELQEIASPRPRICVALPQSKYTITLLESSEDSRNISNLQINGILTHDVEIMHVKLLKDSPKSLFTDSESSPSFWKTVGTPLPCMTPSRISLESWGIHTPSELCLSPLSRLTIPHSCSFSPINQTSASEVRQYTLKHKSTSAPITPNPVATRKKSSAPISPTMNILTFEGKTCVNPEVTQRKVLTTDSLLPVVSSISFTTNNLNLNGNDNSLAVVPNGPFVRVIAPQNQFVTSHKDVENTQKQSSPKVPLLEPLNQDGACCIIL